MLLRGTRKHDGKAVLAVATSCGGIIWTHPYFFQNCQVRSKRDRDGLQSATTAVARETVNHKTSIKKRIEITEQDRTAVVAMATYRTATCGEGG